MGQSRTMPPLMPAVQRLRASRIQRSGSAASARVAAGAVHCTVVVDFDADGIDPEPCLSCLDECGDATLILADAGASAATSARLRRQASVSPRTVHLPAPVTGKDRLPALLQHSDSEWIVLLRADSEPAPGWLDAMLDAAAGGADLVATLPAGDLVAACEPVRPLQLSADADARRSVLAQWSERLRGAGSRRRPRRISVRSRCILLHRDAASALIAHPAVKTGASPFEEVALRAHAVGLKLVTASDALVWQADRRSTPPAGLLESSGEDAAYEKQVWDDAAAEVAALAPETAAGAAPAPVAFRRDRPILFLLPAQSGSGGAHSVAQEVGAMRRLGLRAAIAVPEAFLEGYLASYRGMPELEGAVLGFASSAELRRLAAGYRILVATVFTSIDMMRPVLGAHPRILPAYYIQDYEPMFFPAQRSARAQAEASYTALEFGLRFAKTRWISETVQALHDVPVVKVEPSLDHRVYHPGAREVGTVPVVVAAMLRPSTPRRAPERTARVLARLRQLRGPAVRVVTFGCAREAMPAALAALCEGFDVRGELTREQVADVLREADIFLDLSDYQAFGRTGLEAMACGCVPVLPLAGGCAEFAIDRDNARVVDTRSERACLDAAMELVVDVALRQRLRAAGLRTAERFTPEAAARSELVHFAEALERWTARSLVRVAEAAALAAGTPVRVASLVHEGLEGAAQVLRHPMLLPWCRVRPTPASELDSAECEVICVRLLELEFEPVRTALEARLQRRDGVRLWLHASWEEALPRRLDRALFGAGSRGLMRLLQAAAMISCESDTLAAELRRMGLTVHAAPRCIDESLWRAIPPSPSPRGSILAVTDATPQPALSLALARLQAAAGGRLRIERAAVESLRDELSLARTFSDGGFDLVAVGCGADWLQAGLGCEWQMRAAMSGAVTVLPEHARHRADLLPGCDCVLLRDTVADWESTLGGLLADAGRLHSLATHAAANAGAGALQRCNVDHWLELLAICIHSAGRVDASDEDLVPFNPAQSLLSTP